MKTSLVRFLMTSCLCVLVPSIVDAKLRRRRRTDLRQKK